VLLLLLGVVALFVGAIGLALSQLQGGGGGAFRSAYSRAAGDDLGFPGDWHAGSPALEFAKLDLERRAGLGSALAHTQNRSAFCAPWPRCALPAREPAYRPLCSLLDGWSPNDPAPPAQWAQVGSDPLPRFDFGVAAELALATHYREAEVTNRVARFEHFFSLSEQLTGAPQIYP
jgi:hypothetical protein